ncbi:hypothetical protein E2C01_029054 [Portunus trituberculatus]|uniref:Uncharacterized protein n=1 Tax=Portunus trituberculatus TaxID=210409 RepID=A0A5B7EQT0_PORTR|nr:hypothetical protein [Portunus trituberculatus]
MEGGYQACSASTENITKTRVALDCSSQPGRTFSTAQFNGIQIRQQGGAGRAPRPAALRCGRLPAPDGGGRGALPPPATPTPPQGAAGRPRTTRSITLRAQSH